MSWLNDRDNRSSESQMYTRHYQAKFTSLVVNMDLIPTFMRSYYFEERKDDALTGSKTIADVLYSHSKNKPDREALVFANTDGSREAVTYKELWDNVNILAKSFISLGVRKSEFVAISTRSCPEWVYATFGAILAGASPISLSITYTDGRDVISMMDKLQTCSALVLDPGVADENWKIINKIISSCDRTGKVSSQKMPYLRYLICHDRSNNNYNALKLNEMLNWDNPNCSLPYLNTDDIALLLQTSGSTGIPKGVVHTQRSLIAGGIFFAERMSGKDDILYNDRPFTWVGGFPFSVITGETRVLWSGFCTPPADDIGFMIDVIKREKCTTMVILPPRLSELMQRQDEVGSGWKVLQIATGGQPVSKNFAKCIGKLCKRFVCGYGSTETIFNSSLSVDRDEDFLDYAVGYPNPGIAVKLVDQNGDIVPTNRPGEICIKSDALFKEYYNDPEKTSACRKDDGWFFTGDIGFMTEKGVLYCQGKKAEEIITGGMNVPPTILEALLESFKGVSRVVCVPVPHETKFQVICACIIPEEGSDVTEEELRHFCKEVHNDKPGLFTALPTYYLFMSEFPEIYSGKVSRKKLSKIAKGRLLD